MRALQLASGRLTALAAVVRPQVLGVRSSLVRGVANAKRRNPTAVATSAEAARNQAKPQGSNQTAQQSAGRHGVSRMSLDEEGMRNPRRAAEEFAAEFANSSSSEEVVAAERGPDPYSLEQGPEPQADAQHHEHGFHDEASIAADRVRRDFGREPSSNARPRGGADAIPSESAMPSAAKERSGGRGARKSA